MPPAAPLQDVERAVHIMNNTGKEVILALQGQTSALLPALPAPEQNASTSGKPGKNLSPRLFFAPPLA